jgi:D-sedoheptulose 7-phosphate isomerase
LIDRKPLPAIALTADSSVITCIGNDYQYEDIFSRQITALGQPDDLLIAFTTSGKSSNIIKAINTANLQGVQTVVLTGENGLHGLDADLILPVPSVITARIQEEHDAIIHAICDLVDLSFGEL